MHESRDSIADIWGERTPYRRGHGRCGSTSGRPRSPSAGSSRPACSAPTAAGWTSASRTAGSSACAAGPSTASTAGGSGPKGLHGWEANDSPDRLTRPLVRRGGRLRGGELGRGDGPDRRAVEGDHRERYTGRRDRLLHHGPALPRGVLHARRDRQGGPRHAAHGRQHPALHGDRGGGAEGDVRLRRPARLLRRPRHDRRHPPRRPQHRLAADGALDRASSTAARGPNPPKLVVIDPRTHRRRRSEADVHLAPRVGTNVAAAQRPAAPRSSRPGRSTATSSTRTPSASTRCAETVADVAAGARRGGHGRPRRDRCARRPRSSARRRRWSRRSCRASTSRSRRRPRPCQVNNLHLIRGHDRQARLRRLPDERPADRAEHPRVRRRRRPARASATGTTPSTSPSWPGSGTSSPTIIPHWAPPTHAMQIFRYAEAGSIKLLWISATNPAVSLPELRRIREILAKDGPVRRRAGRLPDRDRRSWPTSSCPRRSGARRPAASPTPTAPSTSRTRRSSRPARRGPTSTSSSTTPGGWTSATRTARPLIKWSDAGGGVRGLEGMHARPALRLHAA